jgi:hypothetical protein
MMMHGPTNVKRNLRLETNIDTVYMTSYAPCISSRANSITQNMKDNILAVTHILNHMEKPEGVVHRMWLHRTQISLPGSVQDVSRGSHHCSDRNMAGTEPLLHQRHTEMQQIHHMCDGSSAYQSITPIALNFPPV